ncbi:penicillin acylase family protein [Sandaracinobacter sp. RS1-74]|uniref:penicillin acylase family protein n=1 Tax=Sandaracinobacteroides sayramensis TaxID=2913411 RepID=UPI001EDB5BD7|nr:penicillin acylase family protein [Sandaracinobacteroides sayramensis]MCG2840194.1 penicillin acylase family protein [Sandaracinobacteroides sayramensis]
MAKRSFVGRVFFWLMWLLGILLLAALLLAGWFWWRMEGSVPKLEGEVAMPGLSAPVSVERDSLGTATVTGETRADVARALGYLHAQDRYFRMDMQRRMAAGELAALAGEPMADIDRRIRPHRFRARARAAVDSMPPGERALLDAYVAGVNQGLSELRAQPFEYLLLRGEAAPWRPEDTMLSVMAMYLNLQPATPQRELDRARAAKALGAEMSAFLYPVTTELDAPLDGSSLPEPPIPSGIAPMRVAPVPDAPGVPVPDDVRIAEAVGSNNWAVGGALTASGAALVANDMHLGLDVPSIWYRARLVVKPAAGSAEAPMDATGVTLPGTPFLVAGSNGRIAWGFTNSYIDTSDAVVVEWVDAKAGSYRTPAGVATVKRVDERLCVKSDCETFPVRETVWGPIVARDAFGRDIAMRWTAHEPDAIRLAAALELERAQSVAQGLEIAHRSGIPQQNFTVGDTAGNIAWTIIGRVPRRVGFDGQEAVSFADGSRRWDGYLTPAETPTVLNPADGRIWTANSRVVGGEGFRKLGDGGYDAAARAGRIQELLLARQRFAPADFLAIQLDDTATRNRFWQQLMLAELQKRDDPRLKAMLAPVTNWGERALPASVGYRLVDRFRKEVVDGLYEGWVGAPEKNMMRRNYVASQAEGPARRLMRERPAALLPKGFGSWDAYLDHVLQAVAEDVDLQAGGDVGRYSWGGVAKAGISHPLARAIAPLAWVTNPKEVAVPGDRPTVRASAPGFGASERFAVSPGREAEGLFHMPGGQAGSPRTPYYLAGHEVWVQGQPTPFLPGAAKWRLEMRPAGQAGESRYPSSPRA